MAVHSSLFHLLIHSSVLNVLWAMACAGGPDLIWDKLWHLVDVRDVADALLLLYEAPRAAGRHICAPHSITARELLALLKSMYPGYPYIAE